ncbi:uncharacterized protein EAE98_012170 [Botrytis deweyae]|uniref:Uncharacterized protein n=1 Tax=Botrytis deweyae TaxID=2478750 RepID=A0ABQ7I3R1_9HELO|nr:uncharacterized protein EAE98_012170 [Botrytis deweyae]KAF7910215.1 hypothetical protein EAE98_012170 [Botrytis deweyae]
MSDDKQLIEVLSLKKTLRPASKIDTNYVKDGKLVYEMFTRNIKSRDISPRLAGQVEAIIEVSNDILKKPNRLFRGTLRRRKLYKQLELLEGGLQKLVDGIKVADEGAKEVKRLHAVNSEEKETHEMENEEKERKITEIEREVKRLHAVNNEEKETHQVKNEEKERKITEPERELRRMEGVQAEAIRKITETEMELRRMEGVQAEAIRKITETERELRRMEGVQAEAIRKQAMQRILLNYGDYVADRCISYNQSPQWDRQYSAKYWSEIHEIIEKEEEIKEKARSFLQKPPLTPMLGHLAMVALELKVPVADIIWDIAAYTERNELCHTDIAIMVKQENWIRLARRTQIDYENVDALLPEEYKDWGPPLKSAIKRFQDKYFSELKIVRTLHITGGFEIRGYTLNTKANDARRAQEEAASEVALIRKKKADEQRQLRIEKKQARKELRASRDSERVSSTCTVLRHKDSALEMDETFWGSDESLSRDLF